MVIDKLVVGQLKTNCYLVYSHEEENCIIIDPGDDAQFIINRINSLNLSPKAIIATHAHFDHLLAVNELKMAYEVPFYLHKRDEVMLKWYRRSTKHFVGFDPGPAPIPDKFINKDTEFEFNDFTLNVIHTPGHTPGGVCLHNEAQNILFCGDTIFAEGGVGRTDFPYSNEKLLNKSIEKLLKLNGRTVFYPGHGDPSSINEFRRSFN